jgi:hypothetical protein
MPRKGYADTNEDSGSDHSIEGMENMDSQTSDQFSQMKHREMIRMEREQVAPKEGELTPMRVSQGEVHRRSFDLFLADSYISVKGDCASPLSHPTRPLTLKEPCGFTPVTQAGRLLVLVCQSE